MQAIFGPPRPKKLKMLAASQTRPRPGTPLIRTSLTMSARVKTVLGSAGSLFSYFGHTPPVTPKSGLHCSFQFSPRRPRLVRNLFGRVQSDLYISSIKTSTMITSSNSPFGGAGCSINSPMSYFTPCPSPSCPAYEPNSSDGEYPQPFRHIQYKRTASRRPSATFAMLLFRRIARCM